MWNVDISEGIDVERVAQKDPLSSVERKSSLISNSKSKNSTVQMSLQKRRHCCETASWTLRIRPPRGCDCMYKTHTRSNQPKGLL